MTPEALAYHAGLMRQVLDRHVGRENAISVADLAPLIDLSDNRDYRDVREVRDSIEEDYPVLSDSKGYWKYDDPREAEDVMATIYGTLKKLARRYARIRRLKKINHPNYQPPLWREDRKAA